jgi:hypothetical protein
MADNNDNAELVIEELLTSRTPLGDLGRRFGPKAGAALSNVLTGFQLGLITRQDVVDSVKEYTSEMT